MSVIFMSVNVMPGHFGSPSFSCPSFSAPRWQCTVAGGAGMEDLLREMALSLCRLQNASDTTTTSGRNVSGGLSCDEAEGEVIEWIYATEFDVLRSPAVAAAVVVVYAVVIVVGTLGSLLVFVSVVSTRQMWTATNVFIANLALTDLVVCAIDLPISLHYQVGNF